MLTHKLSLQVTFKGHVFARPFEGVADISADGEEGELVGTGEGVVVEVVEEEGREGAEQTEDHVDEDHSVEGGDQHPDRRNSGDQPQDGGATPRAHHGQAEYALRRRAGALCHPHGAD